MDELCMRVHLPAIQFGLPNPLERRRVVYDPSAGKRQCPQCRSTVDEKGVKQDEDGQDDNGEKPLKE